MLLQEIELTIKPQSPWLIGDKKAVESYMFSLDYVPGSVLRAGFARLICDSCPYERPNNWVTYENGKFCPKCAWEDMCRSFSEVIFRNCYLKGSKVIPITTMVCKQNPQHRIIDTLAKKIAGNIGGLVCPECGGRVEKAGGFIDGEERVSVAKKLLSRLQLDQKKQVSTAGRLFSIVALAENNPTFKTIISIPKGGKLPSEAVIRLGAYVTSGLGKGTVRIKPTSEDAARMEIAKRVQEFSKLLSEYGLKLNNRKYVAVTLESDGIFEAEKGLGDRKPSSISNDEFLEHFSVALKESAGNNLRLEKIYATHDWRRGFAFKNGKMEQAEPELITVKGSVLVFSFEGNENEVMQELGRMTRLGIGKRTNEGYGEVSVCRWIHIEK